MDSSSLSCLVPNAADLLALEVEELAGVLLIHLNSYRPFPGTPCTSTEASVTTTFLIPLILIITRTTSPSAATSNQR
jgi:hypothetical protein